jgi:hypothetical protein
LPEALAFERFFASLRMTMGWAAQSLWCRSGRLGRRRRSEDEHEDEHEHEEDGSDDDEDENDDEDDRDG